MAKVLFALSLIAIYFYNFQIKQATQKDHNGFSLRIHHWDSPNLPAHQPNLTHEKLMEHLIKMSNVRANTLKDLTSITYNDSSNVVGRIPPLIYGIQSGYLYLVEVGIGTFLTTSPTYKTEYLVLDIATDDIWTQCEGCEPDNCFVQRDPVFPASQSRTYTMIPCNQCPTACQHDRCIVEVRRDNSSIKGTRSRETFTFRPNDDGGDPVQVRLMDFICVTSSQKFIGTVSVNNTASGVFSPSARGFAKFVRRFGDCRKSLEAFSYCLQSLRNPSSQTHMLLRLGGEVLRFSTRRRNTTPIIKGTLPRSASLSPYYVKLRYLSVGETRLQIDPQVFSINPDGSGGCVIDTQLAVTHINRVAYDYLETYMARVIEATNPVLRRVQASSNSTGFDLCYKPVRPQSHQNFSFPTLTFHFYGHGLDDGYANLKVLEPVGSYTYESRIIYCLEAKPLDGLTVIGTIHQANYRFVFDFRNSVLHFKAADCSSLN